MLDTHSLSKSHVKGMTSIRTVIAVSAILIFEIASILCGIDLMYSAALAMWLISLTFALSDLRRRSLYLIFLISFFVFLLGGHFCYEYFGMELKYYFSDELYFHSNLCLFLSLLFVFTGFRISEQTRFKIGRYSFENLKSESDGTDYALSIRKISKTLFILTFPFWVYTIMDKISFVLSNSYYAYYAEYESNAPFAVKAVAAMTPYFLYVFLATLPSKKECRIPVLLYLIYAIISLFTGRRSNFMIMILFLVLYFIFRHYKNQEERWIRRSYVVGIIVFIPLMAGFLQITQFLRVNETISGLSAKELFLSFFQQQGFSSSILRLEKYYEGNLRSDALYSFFGIVKCFRTNTIIRLIFHPNYGFSYLHNSVEFATLGNSLSNALSYITLRTYLSGAGVGSCYIAELYHDFGYIGILIGSLIYGMVMCGINKIWNRNHKLNIFVIAIGFAMVESFIKAPRWNYDIFLAYFLDLGMWMAFILIVLIRKGIRYRI